MHERSTMLRVQMQESADATVFRLEGRFTREGAEHVRTLVAQSNNNGTKLVFDLTDLMFIDSVGEAVLSFLERLGAEFVAETSYSLDVCERLHLPLARQDISGLPLSGGSNERRYSLGSDCRRPMKDRT